MPIDISHTKIDCGGRAVSVDICDPHHRIVVEYDGAYLHAGRDDRDAAKTAQLEASGWTAIRVREAPLHKVGTHDVLVAANELPHRVAAVVLRAAQSVGVPVGDLERYIADDVPLNLSHAENYLDRILSRQAAPDEAGE